MRLDRGTRIFTRFTTKVGQPVWVPYFLLRDRLWLPAIVRGVAVDPDGTAYADIEFEKGANDRTSRGDVPFWWLRERKPHLKGRDKPDEPTPPTHGKPKGIELVGILTNGSVRGRC